MNLSVGDGFKFGCGFLLAALIFWVGMMILFLILSLVGSTVFAGLLSQAGMLGG